MTARRVGIVGATGAVGEEMLRVLEERRFPLAELRLMASARSAGRTMRFAGEDLAVGDAAADGAFRGLDLVLFSAGGGTAHALAPAAVEAGAVVVDNSSAFRLDDQVPLVVPEVNGHVLASPPPRGLVANPNCSTILLVLALDALRQAGLRRVVVSTYQAASGAGRRAVDELHAGLRAVLAGDEPPRPEALPGSLAMDLFPHVDVFAADGYTREEDKAQFESRKILGLPDLRVEATCVRVPVERCHAESVAVELERGLGVEEARKRFAEAPGLELVDEPVADGRGAARTYPTPRAHAGRDAVAVGRVRVSRVFDPGLSFWLVGDQLRKGAALNAVQIAELV